MKFNSAKYNRVEAEVLNHISLITVRLPDGTIINMEGMAPKGSIVAFYCTDIVGGRVLGFDGEIETVFVPAAASKNESLTKIFSPLQEKVT